MPTSIRFRVSAADAAALDAIVATLSEDDPFTSRSRAIRIAVRRMADEIAAKPAEGQNGAEA